MAAAKPKAEKPAKAEQDIVTPEAKKRAVPLFADLREAYKQNNPGVVADLQAYLAIAEKSAPDHPNTKWAQAALKKLK